MVRTRRFSVALCALLLVPPLAACGLASGGGGSDGSVTLRLSHQWPAVDKQGGGDFRSVLAKRFADAVGKRTDDKVEIKLFPANSLIQDPKEQYEAITKGALDMSVYPLDYAAGQAPEFSITLMPAMVPNHDVARRWQTSEIGKRVEAMAEKRGIKILTWVWNAGAIGSKDAKAIASPEDVPKGNVTRAAGTRVEEMLKSVGFGLSSMASSEIYNGMQTGVLDSAITSTGSFSSYRLQEQVKSYTSPSGGYTFWFMFEPLIIGKKQFDKLTPEQQQALVWAGKDLQQFAYDESRKDDERVDQEFKQAGVNVVPMDEQAFGAWQKASEPIWANFAKEVEGGQELIDLAEQAGGQ